MNYTEQSLFVSLLMGAWVMHKVTDGHRALDKTQPQKMKTYGTEGSSH